MSSDDKDRFERNWQPRLWVTIGLLIAIGGYFIAFIVGNSEKTSIDFVFGEARTSLIWVILLSLIAGLVGGVLASQLYRRRQSTSDPSNATPSSISDGDA